MAQIAYARNWFLTFLPLLAVCLICFSSGSATAAPILIRRGTPSKASASSLQYTIGKGGDVKSANGWTNDEYLSWWTQEAVHVRDEADESKNYIACDTKHAHVPKFDGQENTDWSHTQEKVDLIDGKSSTLFDIYTFKSGEFTLQVGNGEQHIRWAFAGNRTKTYKHGQDLIMTFGDRDINNPANHHEGQRRTRHGPAITPPVPGTSIPNLGHPATNDPPAAGGSSSHNHPPITETGGGFLASMMRMHPAHL